MRAACLRGMEVRAAWTTLRASGLSGLTLAVLLGSWLSAVAQDFQVRSWHIEQGLPDGTVTALAQTPDGYLWVGTRKGLVRFDGVSFKRVGDEGATRLQDPSVIGLLVDHRGGLWIASESGLITQFAEGEFRVRYQPPATAPGGSALTGRGPVPTAWRPRMSSLNLLAVEATGAVWVLNIRGGVLRFAGSGPPAAVPLAELPAGEVRALLSDKAGRVWMLKGNCVCVFEDGRWQRLPAAVVGNSSGIIGSAGDRGVWIDDRLGEEGFMKLLQHKGNESWDSLRLALPNRSRQPSVTDVMEDRQGRLWLAMRWGGVYAKAPESGWSRVQALGPLSRCVVLALLEDQDGNVWAGAVGEGLHQVVSPSVKMVMPPPEASDAFVRSVSAESRGGLWLGTSKGLYHWDHGQYSTILMSEALAEDSIQAVLEDAQTNLWVGTSSGLFRRDTSGFERVTHVRGSDAPFLALFQDRAGQLWAGGNAALLCWRGSTNWWVFGPADQKLKLDIRCLTEDAQGAIWAAAYGNGLWRTQDQQLVPAGPAFASLTQDVRSVLFDEEGVLWVGTLHHGLFRWSQGELRHYTMADGLPGDSIIGLTGDDRGNLWITSDNGMMGCARKQLADYVPGQSAPVLCWRLGPTEGLANRGCSGGGQPVISRAPDGRLWAANMVGAAGFRPDEVTHRASTPRVRIETLSADGATLRPVGEQFSARASTRRFEFGYSSPELASPQVVRFRYRLDGLDRTWVEAGANRVAFYSQLLPGEYRFRVMAGGADGSWHEGEQPLRLNIVPPFWQTGWFRSLGFAGAVAAVVGGVAVHERRKARRRLARLEAQQAMERERRRIAQDLHDELGGSITEIVQLGDLTLQPEAGLETLRSCVTTMTRQGRQLAIALDETVWTVNPRNDTLLNLTGYISNHAQEFFRYSGIKCNLDVASDLPNMVVNAQIRHNLFLAVKEAFNNVAKHSGARQVWLRIHCAATALRISIEDNGRGFDLGAAGGGEGLTNMRERLQAAKGTAEFLSQIGQGTTVVFTLATANGRGGEPEASPQ